MSVNVELTETVVNIGADVKVTCEVTNPNQIKDFFIHWIKKSGPKDKMTSIVMGTNHIIDGIFKTLGRYKASYEVIEGNLKKVKFTLSIKVPIRSLKLRSFLGSNGHTSVAEYGNGQKVQFQESEIRKFVCNASGSYPAADVDVYIGDKKITDLFERKVEARQEGKDKDIYAWKYDVLLVNESLEIDYNFNRKTLLCVATVPQSKFEAVNISIDIRLLGYTPKFDCHHTVTMPMYTRNVSMQCKVRSDPPLSQAHFFWEKKAGNVTLKPGDAHGHYRGFLENSDNDYEKTMTLTLERAFTEHFRPYTFSATNSLGTGSHVITLKQDGRKDQEEDAVKDQKTTTELVRSGEVFGDKGESSSTKPLHWLGALALFAVALIL